MAKILLIGDLVGYGRLAVGAQMSVLQPMGHSVANLPTALVSNNFCYQHYAMLDTTTYMRQSIQTWDSLGFLFDVIMVGFVASDKQAELIATFCQEQKKRGAYILVDPIMADNGSLYSGLGTETISRLRTIVSLADLTVPNYTEACLLTNTPFRPNGLTINEVRPIIDQLREMGANSILITSCQVDGKAHVVGYDHQHDAYLQLPYREIPVQFSGTGDIFTAMLMGKLLGGKSLTAATQITMEQLSALIDTNQDVENKAEGLPLS